MIAACAVAGVLIIAAIYATYRAANWQPRSGKHAKLFADPADVTDPDGSVWLRTLQPDRTTLVRSPEVRHELSPFPSAGRLEMLPPDPPPDETRPQPVIKDVAACELGMSTQDYVDGVFAPAEASLNAMVAKYAEVTA